MLLRVFPGGDGVSGQQGRVGPVDLRSQEGCRVRNAYHLVNDGGGFRREKEVACF